MDNKSNYQQNAQKLKAFVRRGQILPCRVIKIVNEREVILSIHSLEIKAYTNIAFEKGDRAFLRIDQIEDQLRFKLLDEEELSRIQNSGIDYTI